MSDLTVYSFKIAVGLSQYWYAAVVVTLLEVGIWYTGVLCRLFIVMNL